MRSYFLVLVRSLAAVFCTSWRLLVVELGKPENSALQSSNLYNINAWISVSASTVDNIGLILAMFLR